MLAGFGMMVQMAASNTLIQTMVTDEKRGRVMSFYSMAFLGMAPFGGLLAGALAHRIGAPRTVAVSGVACVFAAAWFATRLPALRRVMRPVYRELGTFRRLSRWRRRRRAAEAYRSAPGPERRTNPRQRRPEVASPTAAGSSLRSCDRAAIAPPEAPALGASRWFARLWAVVAGISIAICRRCLSVAYPLPLRDPMTDIAPPTPGAFAPYSRRSLRPVDVGHVRLEGQGLFPRVPRRACAPRAGGRDAQAGGGALPAPPSPTRTTAPPCLRARRRDGRVRVLCWWRTSTSWRTWCGAAKVQPSSRARNAPDAKLRAGGGRICHERAAWLRHVLRTHRVPTWRPTSPTW